LRQGPGETTEPHQEAAGQGSQARAGEVSIFANAASLMVSRLAVAAMGWSGTVLIVRHLSVANWGRFSFVFGLLGMMSVVSSMANPRVVFRELANDDGRLAGTYVLLRLALGVLGYAVAISFVAIGHYPPVVLRAVLIAGLTLVIANSASGYNVIFEFRMKLTSMAVAATLGQAAQLVLTIVLALMHSSLVLFTVPAVLCEVVAIAWKLYRLPKHPALHYGFLWHQWIELLKLSIPLALGGALSTLYYNLDTVMLSKMQTFRAVGIYGISYKFAGIVTTVDVSMTPALYPILVRYWPEEGDRFRRVTERTARLFFVIGALVIAEFTIFSARAIALLYGHNYVIGANAARLVVASECVGFFSTLAVVALVSVNRNVVYPVVALGGLILNLGINLWVIPRWSYMGAAWATLITEVAVALCLWVPMKRATGMRLMGIGPVLKVLLCSGVAVGTSLGIWQVAPWPAAGAAGAVVYVIALSITRVGDGGLKSIVTLDDKQAATT